MRGGFWGGGSLGGSEFGRFRESDTPLDVARDVARYLNNKGFVSVLDDRLEFVKSIRAWNRYLDEFVSNSEGTQLVFRDEGQTFAAVVFRTGKWHGEIMDPKSVLLGDSYKPILQSTYKTYVGTCTALGGEPIDFETYLSGWSVVGVLELRNWRLHLDFFPSADAARKAETSGARLPITQLQELGISRAVAIAWFKAGFTESEAFRWWVLWTTCGKSDTFERFVFDAQEWRAADFDPASCGRWLRNGWTPENAKAWRDIGFGPSEARQWEKSGICPLDAAVWLNLGYEGSQAQELIDNAIAPLVEQEQPMNGATPTGLDSHLQRHLERSRKISRPSSLREFLSATFEIPTKSPLGEVMYRAISLRLKMAFYPELLPNHDYVTNYTDQALNWVLVNWVMYGQNNELPVVQEALLELIRREKWKGFLG